MDCACGFKDMGVINNGASSTIVRDECNSVFGLSRTFFLATVFILWSS